MVGTTALTDVDGPGTGGKREMPWLGEGAEPSWNVQGKKADYRESEGKENYSHHDRFPRRGGSPQAQRFSLKTKRHIV